MAHARANAHWARALTRTTLAKHAQKRTSRGKLRWPGPPCAAAKCGSARGSARPSAPPATSHETEPTATTKQPSHRERWRLGDAAHKAPQNRVRRPVISHVRSEDRRRFNLSASPRLAISGVGVVRTRKNSRMYRSRWHVEENWQGTLTPDFHLNWCSLVNGYDCIICEAHVICW